MLTGKQLRVRNARDRVIPLYIAVEKPWLEIADRLLGLFRGQEGRTRGALDDDVKQSFGGDPKQLVHQGLAKLLEDRCEFEVVSGRPPEQLRAAVFRAAAQRQALLAAAPPDGGHDKLAAYCDRAAVLAAVAQELELTPEAVDQGLFADLKSEQRLIRFKDISPERLLARYNVALAQGVLLRSTGVHIEIRGEKPARLRQLFRLVKFHRLVCDTERGDKDALILRLDGPLSLFSAIQKYGLQLALFLPAVLRCARFALRADILWGPQRKRKVFTLSPSDGLVADGPDHGTHVPQELLLFAELFRKKVKDWELHEETGVFPLGAGPGGGFWVPDFRLVHGPTGRAVYLEVLGCWRRAGAERHLQRLRQHASNPFLLAVSDQLHIEDADLEGLPAGIHRFRQMPLPDEVARLADMLLS